MSKNKRSLLDLFFGKSKKVTGEINRLQMVSSFNPVFTSLGTDIYQSKVARQCIDRIATNIGKLVPKHIQTISSDRVSYINGDINAILNNPNPLMTTYDFLYKVSSQLDTYNNAFVYINKDMEGMITGLYPILATTCELFENKRGEIFLQFTFITGKTYTLPYLDLIHLRKFYNGRDIFGSDNQVLLNDLVAADTASQGINNAIRTSNNLRGIIKYSNAMLSPEDQQKAKDTFVNDYLSLENESGIASLDAKAEFLPIKMDPITLDKDQMDRINKNIFDYFGISEKIVNNSYSEEEWAAFYEGVIEPRAIQLSQAFTSKIFSDRAIADGHKIEFTTNRIHYASLATKIKMIDTLAPFGMIMIDEAREILDLPSLGGEAGQKILQSLNNIDSSIANEYQSNKEG